MHGGVEQGGRDVVTMTFQRDSSGRWQARARTDGGELEAHGETLREARLALEQLLRMRAVAAG